MDGGDSSSYFGKLYRRGRETAKDGDIQQMENRQRTLTNEEKSLLLDSLQKHMPELVEKLDLLDSGPVDARIIDEMRSAVGSELVNKGFDRNLEPNEYGWKLENLIDALADIYLWPDKNKRRRLGQRP